MSYFAAEIGANCTAHYEEYFFGVYYVPILCGGFYCFGGFYFWLDVISTACRETAADTRTISDPL